MPWYYKQLLSFRETTSNYNPFNINSKSKKKLYPYFTSYISKINARLNKMSSVNVKKLRHKRKKFRLEKRDNGMRYTFFELTITNDVMRKNIVRYKFLNCILYIYIYHIPC